MRIFPINILNLFIFLPYSPFNILFPFLPAFKCMYFDFLAFILIYIMNILTLNFYSDCGYDISSSADFHKICRDISMRNILSLFYTKLLLRYFNSYSFIFPVYPPSLSLTDKITLLTIVACFPEIFIVNIKTSLP